MSISSLYRQGKSLITSKKSTPSPGPASNFSKEPIYALFPKVDPSVDGPDCLEDCSTCTIHYPPKFSIDEEEELYGHIKGWATHMLVATGKADWKKDVEDEKGSVMEAVRDCGVSPNNGVYYRLQTNEICTADRLHRSRDLCFLPPICHYPKSMATN